MRKLISFIATSAILLNSFYAPLTAIAQEMDSTPLTTPEPTPEATSTPEPTQTPEETIVPTEEPTVSPIPSETPADLATPTEEPTIVPEETLTPAPTDQPSQTQDPESVPTTPGPPLDSPEPTAEVVEASSLPTDENAEVTTQVVTKELFPETVQENSVVKLITDKLDYAPTEIAIITGSGFTPDKTYSLTVSSSNDPATSTTVDITANENGEFTYEYQLDGKYRPNYLVEVKDGGELVASTSFTDGNPSANIDQYANIDNAWVNGNLGTSNSSYFEGDSVPYRMVFDNLDTSISHTITIKWDTAKSDKHALDYLTSFDRSYLPDPCAGISGCGSPSTYSITKDPQVDNGSGIPITQIAGSFTLYNGTIIGLSSYSYPDGSGFVGDKSAQITITFTTTVDNPVLAWGGHISDRHDWGANNSAISVPGSPYHMRLVDLDGKGGNQDRSLSAAAVIFPGSITIIKDATPNGSTAFSFTGSPTPVTNFSLTDDGTSANTRLFSGITNFQTYTINETPIPSGWGFDSVSCSATSANGGSYIVTSVSVNIDLKEGENWTCTYLNSVRTGTLKVIKHVVNDNGGTLNAANFTLHVKSGTTDVTGSPANGSETGTNYTLVGGTYNVSENTLPTGYIMTGYSGDCDSSGNVTVVAGQTKTCTITNNDIQPKLTVTKIVTNDNGGTKVISDFPLFVGRTSVTSGVQNGFDAGTYTVSETQQTGYAMTGITGDCAANGNITLAPGDIKSCTITNNDIIPALHLRKTITNDNGGTAVATDWTLTATGTVVTPTNLSGTTPVDSGSTFKADTYALAESGGPSGYSAGRWDCGGAQMPDATHVVIPLGVDVTCTINNNDIAPSLTLNKILSISHGGNETESAWTLTATGDQSIPKILTGPGAVGSLDVVSDSTFQSGTYTLSESGVAGYNASSWSCTGSGSQTGNQITLDIGESAVCSIINSDIAPTITLIKSVQSLFGGTAGVNSFGLTIGGTPVTSGQVLSVNANTAYALNEAGLFGYEFVSLTGTLCPISLGGTITLNEGGSIICTITNRDIQPKLTIIKHVINNNGGNNTASDFTMTVTGTNVSQSSFNGSETGTIVGLDAGNFSVSESGPSGYSQSTSGDCSGTIAVGETKICTITNDDIAPKLTLVKTVVNNNGGTLGVSDFPLFINEKPVTSGVANTLLANKLYTASETGKSGYAASVWGGNCAQDGTITLLPGDDKTCTITNSDQPATLHIVKVVNNGTTGSTKSYADFSFSVNGGSAISFENDGQNDLTVNAGTYNITEPTVAGYSTLYNNCSSVVIPNGGEATCTITNTAIAPQLKLVKTVITDDGGTKQVSDFVLKLDSTIVTSGQFNVTTIGPHTVSEKSVNGYQPSVWGGDCASDGSITLGLADIKTCTITNDDIAPTLTLVKEVINNNGGTSSASAWTLSATGDGGISGTGTVGPTNVKANVTYALSESGPAGYTAGTWNCVGGVMGVSAPTITLTEGESAVCTIANNDNAPSLKLVKSINYGPKSTDDWDLSATGDSGFTDKGNSTTFHSVLANTAYTLSESAVEGYTQEGGWTCDKGLLEGNVLTLSLTDQETTCTVTNFRDMGRILIHKNIDINGDGDWDETNETSDIYANNNGFSFNFYSGQREYGVELSSIPTTTTYVNYPISENMPSDYHFVSWFNNNDKEASCTNPTGYIMPSEVQIIKDTLTEITLCNMREVPSINITKSNNSGSGFRAGSIVTYTLTVKNNGNVVLSNIDVTDYLPGGFSYITDSTTGDITTNPYNITPSGTLTWNYPLALGVGESITFNYQTKTASDLSDGIYTNFATCAASYGQVFEVASLLQRETGGLISCNTDSSTVNIGSTFSYGGSLGGQVLGISTELPATGNPTWILLIALGLTGTGIYLNIRSKKQNKYAKN